MSSNVHRQYARLIHRICQEYLPPTHSNYEDLVQAGQIGLIHAASSWKADRSPFTNWAARCIRWEILDEIRKIQGIRVQDYRANRVGDLPVPPQTVTPDYAEPVRVQNLLNPLNKQQQQLVIDVVVYERSFSQIARQLGVTRQSIWERYHQAIAKLRRYHVQTQ